MKKRDRRTDHALRRSFFHYAVEGILGCLCTSSFVNDGCGKAATLHAATTEVEEDNCRRKRGSRRDAVEMVRRKKGDNFQLKYFCMVWKGN